jgi:muramoyltetrapeptide carboxypeptidase
MDRFSKVYSDGCMNCNRRSFLMASGMAFLATQMPVGAQQPPVSVPLKPARLKPGDTVGLVNPASSLDPEDVGFAKQELARLGLNVKVAPHVNDQYGYLGGRDADRATDVNVMFGDPAVKALIAMRGGWGCNRILPLLNYELIRNNPKIIIGYSDITSLLLGIYAKSQLVTFHGPVGTSNWNPFSVNYFKQILFNAEAVKLQNSGASSQVRVSTITAGKARGKLVGGNLSVLTAMIGSPYLPAWDQTILFVEEVGEEVYRVDRMLTQLKLAGILDQIAGFIFGQCTDCDPEEPAQSLSLGQVLMDHIRPLKIPAWYGSMIGHIKDKFTVPVGVDVEIDANTGTIQLLEPAVR